MLLSTASIPTGVLPVHVGVSLEAPSGVVARDEKQAQNTIKRDRTRARFLSVIAQRRGDCAEKDVIAHRYFPKRRDSGAPAKPQFEDVARDARADYRNKTFIIIGLC
jgi:hypothetical protein